MNYSKQLLLTGEIDDVGGMVKAIEMGIPKMRIEESSAKRQAKVDSEEQIIVGVNKYKPTEKQDINILSIDNDKVRKKQISALNELKKSRDNKIVDKYKSRIKVLDHYAISQKWHSEIKKKNLKLIVIDDLANRKYNCDLLFDNTPGRKKQGDIVYADGTNFDPGSGEGIYFVNAAGNYTKL